MLCVMRKYIPFLESIYIWIKKKSLNSFYNYLVLPCVVQEKTQDNVTKFAIRQNLK